MKFIKRLALAVTLSASACASAEPKPFVDNPNVNGIIAIGDSLTVWGKTWVKVLREQYQAEIRTLAQTGRRVDTYDPPRDLMPLFYPNVIYFLGANDVDRTQSDMGQEYFKRKSGAHLAGLDQKGFRITVILPPNLGPGFARVRTALIEHCVEMNLTCVDIGEVYDRKMTVDGIHPTDELQFLMAMKIWEEMNR